MASMGSNTGLLNLLGEVKARVQDKLGNVDFPMPQFICIGTQSVGKSRLVETLAGETFNFVSGTLGSRRPTVLELRNVTSIQTSRWFVRDLKTKQWGEHPVAQVMRIVGAAHEDCGGSVSPEPIHVRIESPHCVDVSLVDLPGFRDYESKHELSKQIHDLNMEFMTKLHNVMLCVEECGDASVMSSLQKCHDIDPHFQRTILVRNKLDKYYNDLTHTNVHAWFDGHGELPNNLTRFALTLPWWPDGAAPPKPFADLRQEKHDEDVRRLAGLELDARRLKSVGFHSFAAFMESRIEDIFADAVGPVLDSLKELKSSSEGRKRMLDTEYAETNPERILSTTRDCGTSLATALHHVMEGIPNLKVNCMTLDAELRQFHDYHSRRGSDFIVLPSEEFADLDDYIEYLTSEAQVPAADVEVNGGAQFRRVMAECEIFLRFSEVAGETRKRDIIQARGISMNSLTWREVVVKLLSKEAHSPLEQRVRYVGERFKWFFEMQKDVVVGFMDSLDSHSSSAKMYSSLYPKHSKLIRQNEMIKHLVFQTYSDACSRQLDQFLALFENVLTSTFSNPWVFLKTGTVGLPPGIETEDLRDRIPKEIQSRSRIESTLNAWLMDIPEDAQLVDEAVDRVQKLILRIYSLIRSQVCDQVEIMAESFFKLPMLRRLAEDMANISLSDADRSNYQLRRDRLASDMSALTDNHKEISEVLERLQNFKFGSEARRGV